MFALSAIGPAFSLWADDCRTMSGHLSDYSLDDVHAKDLIISFLSPSLFLSATVHITVNDINEFGPTFNQPSYVVDVDEGRPADKILQVEATDGDCSAKYGDICRYELLNKDQPFSIDSEGSCLSCFSSCIIITKSWGTIRVVHSVRLHYHAAVVEEREKSPI